MLAAALAAAVALVGCGGGRPTPPATPPPTPAATAPSTAAPGATASPAGTAPHVMVVVLENREASTVLGGKDAPYFNSLARRYGVAVNAYGRTHPSLPNYLDLISGSTQGITSDCTGCTARGPTVADQLSAAGVPWKAYMEAMPSPCFQGASAGDYAKKHDPFVYFPALVANRQLCDRVVPFNQLAADLASPDPPAFMWVTPDLCDDGHDCPNSAMDSWLSRTVPRVLASPWYSSGGIVIITFDEGSSDASCCGGADGGRIATLVVTDRVPGGARSTTPVDEAGILATVEDLYHLPHLGEAASPASGNLLALTGPA